MAVPPASPLFLRAPEIRRGAELLYFGYSHLYRQTDRKLAEYGLGRAHHRALYFVGRQPDMTIGTLLRLLGITKQSLGRVLADLAERELMASRPGDEDRRQRLLRLTEKGAILENELFEGMREKLGAAYANAGQEAVTGFWRVLEQLIPVSERSRVADLEKASAGS